MTSFQSGFKFGKQEKDSRAKSREQGGSGTMDVRYFAR